MIIIEVLCRQAVTDMYFGNCIVLLVPTPCIIFSQYFSLIVI